MVGVNQDEASYFYPCKCSKALHVYEYINIFFYNLFDSLPVTLPLVITEAFYNQNPHYHEQELIPKFLEAATFFKGSVRERVMPAILFTYFNGVDLSNLTSIAHRFINVSLFTWNDVRLSLKLLNLLL